MDSSTSTQAKALPESSTIRNFGEYYKHRVTNAPERYFHDMVSNRDGRSDLDGICPYNPSPGQELEPPTAAQLRAWWDRKAGPDPFSEHIRQWAVREWDQMPTIVNVAIRLEKVMDFLVQAGFTPDSIANFNEGGPKSRRERMWGGDSEFLAQSHERGLS